MRDWPTGRDKESILEAYSVTSRTDTELPDSFPYKTTARSRMQSLAVTVFTALLDSSSEGFYALIGVHPNVWT